MLLKFRYVNFQNCPLTVQFIGRRLLRMDANYTCATNLALQFIPFYVLVYRIQPKFRRVVNGEKALLNVSRVETKLTL